MTYGRPATTLIAFTGLILGTSASAQEQIVERCKQTSSKDDRIACLEAALLMRDGTEATQIDPPSITLSSGTADTKSSRAAATDSAPVSAAAEATNSQQQPPSGIGAEQVIARQQTQEERNAALQRSEKLAVASYRELAFGRLQVTLENGQVWEQIKGDTRKVRADLRKNQTVNIEESSFGGYKLRLNEMRMEIRVRRIR
ncbi:MAG: hypothetical protein AAGA33_14265 [Pseudomonadota bacterium]